MKLLLFTQSLDRKDSTLSAYHRLVAEIAANFESVTAICLKKGDVDLPKNVTVLSLGKEDGISRIKYISRFYKYIFKNEYDAVFVHMNQEYILLGGIFWKYMGKKVYMWRNHHSGGVLTDIAAAFCEKVFCTSKFSYTAKYPKTVIMPVGIDTDLFKRRLDVERKPQSILFLGRIAPVKKPDVLIEALNLLKSKGVDFTASFYGDALPKDVAYAASLKEKTAALGLDCMVSFFAGVPNDQTPAVYSSHEVCVNLSSSGMYDKTIFESMACETLTVASNRNLYDLVEDSYIFEEDDPWMLAERIEDIFAFSAREKEKMGARLRHVVMSHHSLKELGQKIAKEIV